MRERTPFPRALIEQLPNLKLLITTGGRNRGIDLEACAERGITVCGTSSFAHPTVDLTWGLILSLMRRIPEQEAALRQGRWQVKLGNYAGGQDARLRRARQSRQPGRQGRRRLRDEGHRLEPEPDAGEGRRGRRHAR